MKNACLYLYRTNFLVKNILIHEDYIHNLSFAIFRYATALVIRLDSSPPHFFVMLREDFKSSAAWIREPIACPNFSSCCISSIDTWLSTSESQKNAPQISYSNILGEINWNGLHIQDAWFGLYRSFFTAEISLWLSSSSSNRTRFIEIIWGSTIFF